MKRLIAIGWLFGCLSFSSVLLAQQTQDAQGQGPEQGPEQNSDNVDVATEIRQLKADVDRLNQEIAVLANEIQRLQNAPTQAAGTRTSKTSARVSRPTPVSTPAPAAPAATSPTVADADVPVTVLLFSDGRRVETRNYAIVGEIIWVYNERESRKYPVSDLDLDATKKANSDRGVPFQLPPAP